MDFISIVNKFTNISIPNQVFLNNYENNQVNNFNNIKNEYQLPLSVPLRPIQQN